MANVLPAICFAVGLAFGLVLSFIFINYTDVHSLTTGRFVHWIDHSISGSPDGLHNAINAVQSPKQEYIFDDEKFHQHDDKSVANHLYKNIRVLCWVMTAPKNLQSKAKHVKATWGRRCNKLLFMSSKEDVTFPAVGLNIGEGRGHLTAKTMRAFKYVYDHHFNDADWFMKADDDTYVIVENLRYLLSSHNHTEPVYFGHHFKVIVKQGYTSGGAGYIMSKEALKRFAEKGYDKICSKDGGAEDVQMGQCMQSLGVKVGDSRDAAHRSRFHCFTPETHLFGGYPAWYLQYDKYGAKHGQGNISDYSITFHYVNPQGMYALEFYVYHLRPYGITDHFQHLNIGEIGHEHHKKLEQAAKSENSKVKQIYKAKD